MAEWFKDSIQWETARAGAVKSTIPYVHLFLQLSA